ncbi:hypothetical protein, variant [Allomyces macrogynus ATCC 38327]|nr:hypothetical protein, variant [Allomyces macrogynus ATCC 38327]|eukprot:KNE68527.1 hypothetical protein, variant [Allomyces macrogynus ATCC 38327]
MYANYPELCRILELDLDFDLDNPSTRDEAESPPRDFGLKKIMLARPLTRQAGPASSLSKRIHDLETRVAAAHAVQNDLLVPRQSRSGSRGNSDCAMSSPTDFDFAQSPSPSPSPPPPLPLSQFSSVPPFQPETMIARMTPDYETGATTKMTGAAFRGQYPADPFLVSLPDAQPDEIDRFLQSLAPGHEPCPQDVLSKHMTPVQAMNSKSDTTGTHAAPAPYLHTETESLLSFLIGHHDELVGLAKILPLQDDASVQITDHGPTAEGGGDHELEDAMAIDFLLANTPGQHHLTQVASTSAPTCGTMMPATAAALAMPVAMISASAPATSPVSMHGVHASVSSTVVASDLAQKTAAVHDAIKQAEAALQAVREAKTALGASLAQVKDVAADTLTRTSIGNAQGALDAQPNIQGMPSATAPPSSTLDHAPLNRADAIATNAAQGPVANSPQQDADGDESMEDGGDDAGTSESVAKDADPMINVHTNHYKLRYKDVPKMLRVPKPFKVPAPLSPDDWINTKKRNAYDAALSRARRWALLRYFEDECIRLSARPPVR